MQILIAGASGFVGQHLTRYLKSKGHSVKALTHTRNKVDSHTFFWNPKESSIDLKAFEGVDAVINLAGENVGGGRWTSSCKQAILQSRLDATRTLVQAIAKLPNPPQVLINASAVGFYGDAGDQVCYEDRPGGKGFLASVCQQWEEAANLAPIRTVILRFGIVLSPNERFLKQIVPLFRLGLGATLGSGKQYMSWIAIDDLVRLLEFALPLKGTFNAVAPHPLTHQAFTLALAKALHRPALFSVPAWALRWMLGKEKASELVLNSQRARPSKIEALGFSFLHPDLPNTLKTWYCKK